MTTGRINQVAILLSQTKSAQRIHSFEERDSHRKHYESLRQNIPNSLHFTRSSFKVRALELNFPRIALTTFSLLKKTYWPTHEWKFVFHSLTFASNSQ